MTKWEHLFWFLGSAAASVGILVVAGSPQVQGGWQQAGLMVTFLATIIMSIFVCYALTKSHETGTY